MLDMSKFSIGQILFIIHTILNSQLSQSELPCQLVDKIYSSINARVNVIHFSICRILLIWYGGQLKYSNNKVVELKETSNVYSITNCRFWISK
jgi:hypothetical protein